jgi:4-alpha-glucanotransferase
VKYEAVKPLKQALLERAFAGFPWARGKSITLCSGAVPFFAAAEQSWLDDYTLFRVLMKRTTNRETLG